MTLDDRVTLVERAVVRIDGSLTRIEQLLTDQGQLLRDVVTLLADQGDRLDKIEAAIRERGFNGHRP